MPDYKEMYLKLFRASEEAVNVLIAAQRECEELYVSAPEPELKVITLPERSCGDDAKQKNHTKIKKKSSD
ncbi:MAG: hypothetical protein VB064_11880 [Oscillospiraceae bacterium]|nr:hypothetical protein [Oscillospiraceae bacterium]